MFSDSQEAAIKEKLGQLEKIKDGTLSREELAKMITERRDGWLNDNFDEMMEKYLNYPIAEKAYRIVFLEHMKINPQDSDIYKNNTREIKIYSKNFCPYLVACNQLELECWRAINPGDDGDN